MVLHAAVARALDAFATQMRCPICLEALSRPFSLPCNHFFCEACIHTALGFATTCPVCKAMVRKRTLRHDTSVQRIQDALQKLMAMRPAIEAPVPAVTVPTSICIDLCSEESEYEQSNSVTQATQIDAPPLVPVVAPETEVHNAILSPERPPQTEVFTGGQVVEVSARTWPGINKLGGTAWIVRRNDDGTYNVKYVLGGREGRVDPVYIRSAGTSNNDNNSSDDARTSPAPSSARTIPSRKRLSPAIESPPPAAPKKAKKAVHIREALVFLCSGLNHDEKTLVESCAQLVGATTVHEWTESVTHVIVKCQHAAPMRQKLQLSDKVNRWVKIRSIKYLKAVVSGRWIVSDAWIQGPFFIAFSTHGTDVR
ncbi:hypothetical protein, variant [Saprolegnia diclina VS20]|uniref:RING-type domain-containing protein n=1 Tax=Saprolegnia diclina (strain VS20) TaxID=1156394 RepID=T0QKK9_SAPDV|nr:hypothetical protein, variant [Saprolegnia diclina VS20]EQC38549.1 hypothetical protein, variant [Saprolegnia diclina VS20]|eukprot:XP_008608141.1 hypothetical protein, variant [Saprolegnia diclina VS20]